MPAEGPSFGVAPSGTCVWKSFFSNIGGIIPYENKKDLTEIPKIIKKSIEIIPVKNVDEVLKVALVKKLKRVEWVEVEQIPAKTKSKSVVTSRH